VDIEVVNIVASALIGSELNLEKISAQIDYVDYDPARFPGAICRIKEPKTALLLFASGKTVCTGARRLEDVRSVIEMVMKELEAIGEKMSTSPEITVQNIVATCDLKLDNKLKLSHVAISLGLENIEYEPEQFPGLVYRVRAGAVPWPGLSRPGTKGRSPSFQHREDGLHRGKEDGGHRTGRGGNR